MRSLRLKLPPSKGGLLLILGVFAGTLMLAVAVAALRNYPGQRLTFGFFLVAFASMAILCLPRPRLYGYTFLAAFLFLGFCGKALAHFGLGVVLLEPVGSFTWTGRAWDEALLPALVAACALILARVAHLLLARRLKQPATPVQLPPPTWFAARSRPMLISSVLAIALINLLNVTTSIYQIGIVPRVFLPLHLNALISWLLLVGLAMWSSTLLGWQLQLKSSRFITALLLPFTEAVSATSTLSRSAYLFRALAYLMVAIDFPRFIRAQLQRRTAVLVGGLVLIGLVISVAGVSALRIVLYPAPTLVSVAPSAPKASGSPMQTQSGQPTTSNSPAGSLANNPNASALPGKPVDLAVRAHWAATEVSSLIVGRWVGLEGTMAVSSSRGLGMGMLVRGIRESPSSGEASLYQRLSNAPYQTANQWVFLTTPGAVAVLYYSGSLALVFAGMFLLTAFLLIFEVAAARMLGNAFTVSIATLAFANAIAQMNFPYLFAVFVVEQAIALIALSVLGRGLWLPVRRMRKGALMRGSAQQQ